MWETQVRPALEKLVEGGGQSRRKHVLEYRYQQGVLSAEEGLVTCCGGGLGRAGDTWAVHGAH